MQYLEPKNIALSLFQAVLFKLSGRQGICPDREGQRTAKISELREHNENR